MGVERRRWGRVRQHGARSSRCRRRADHGGGRHRGLAVLDVQVERAAALMLEALAGPVHFPTIAVVGLDIVAVEMLIAGRNQNADRHRWWPTRIARRSRGTRGHTWRLGPLRYMAPSGPCAPTRGPWIPTPSPEEVADTAVSPISMDRSNSLSLDVQADLALSPTITVFGLNIVASTPITMPAPAALLGMVAIVAPPAHGNPTARAAHADPHAPMPRR
jgi:hypothetical protein